MVLFFFMVKKRNIANIALFWGSKTALSKFTQLFLPQILWSWYNSRVFWNAAAFSFERFSKTLGVMFLFFLKTGNSVITNIFLFPKFNFYENFTTQLFFGQSAPLHPKQKLIFFSGSVMWKLKAAAFQNTLELYHDQRIWGRNNYVNLDNAVLLPPKNALFSLLLDIKLFLTMKNLKHCFKWPTPLEWYDRDCLLSLVWGYQHILILALEFFQRSGHHMVPISCKAS